MTPLSLYIHIPWCVRKCPYCDFNSHAKQAALPETRYIDAMLEDLDQDLALIQDRLIESVFIGGGTPSLFSPESYALLFAGLQQRLQFVADCEITLEANPGTLEQGRFQGYRDCGINRLSIGVQSFDAQQLEQLGRIHGAREAHRAIEQCRAAGFDNFNVDLMHGLPQQTCDQALHDLQQAIDSGAPHISWYQLTIEPNTEFYNRPPPLPFEPDIHAMQLAGHSRLAEAGFGRYEVSAFSRPGHRARHNLNYWEFGDYLALGAGAHGKITTADGHVVRYQKTRKPEDYLARTPSRTSKQTNVSAEDMPLEFMMNALRLRDGFSHALLEQRGVASADTAAKLMRLVADGLLEVNDERYRATQRGYDLIDSILAEFLPE